MYICIHPFILKKKTRNWSLFKIEEAKNKERH